MPSINFHRAQFQLAAPSLQHCPPETGAEVAFAGRSNAGKSSAINALTNNRKLARTSKTPGRTQLINFFKLDDDAQLRLADLPGYGYAKVPLAKKREWQANLTEYLYDRKSLRGLILLMDIRHPLQEFDRQMLEWARTVNMPAHVLLTKSDKLKRGPAKSTMLAVRKEIQAMAPGQQLSVQTFSAMNKDGMDTLEKVLNQWLEPQNEEETVSI